MMGILVANQQPYGTKDWEQLVSKLCSQVLQLKKAKSVQESWNVN